MLGGWRPSRRSATWSATTRCAASPSPCDRHDDPRRSEAGTEPREVLAYLRARARRAAPRADLGDRPRRVDPLGLAVLGRTPPGTRTPPAGAARGQVAGRGRRLPRDPHPPRRAGLPRPPRRPAHRAPPHRQHRHPPARRRPATAPPTRSVVMDTAPAPNAAPTSTPPAPSAPPPASNPPATRGSPATTTASPAPSRICLASALGSVSTLVPATTMTYPGSATTWLGSMTTALPASSTTAASPPSGWPSATCGATPSVAGLVPNHGVHQAIRTVDRLRADYGDLTRLLGQVPGRDRLAPASGGRTPSRQSIKF